MKKLLYALLGIIFGIALFFLFLFIALAAFYIMIEGR